MISTLTGNLKIFCKNTQECSETCVHMVPSWCSQSGFPINSQDSLKIQAYLQIIVFTSCQFAVLNLVSLEIHKICQYCEIIERYSKLKNVIKPSFSRKKYFFQTCFHVVSIQ